MNDEANLHNTVREVIKVRGIAVIIFRKELGGIPNGVIIKLPIEITKQIYTFYVVDTDVKRA